ncbi:MAG TPA: ribonuclease E inhibitor RraB [Burkholderiaceae bacterium]|jgi:hypothetical protein
MGIFEFLPFLPKQFVTRRAFEKNLAKQLEMTPLTLAQLRKYGVTPSTELKLEYFFYTNTSVKAVALAADLQNLLYEVSHGPSASNRKVEIVTGWTCAIPMREDVLLNWTKAMCEVGFRNDSDFDGWGTNPSQ